MSFMSYFWSVFALVLIFELWIVFRHSNLSKYDRRHDKNSLVLLLFGIFLCLGLILLIDFMKFFTVYWDFQYFGFFLLILGFIIRQWSVIVLGKSFVPIVSVRKGQKVVDKGPFKYIRHPSYTGFLLEALGFGFVLAGWIGSIIVLIFLIPTINYRILIEEKFLKINLKGYREYMLKTWKLVPWVY